MGTFTYQAFTHSKDRLHSIKEETMSACCAARRLFALALLAVPGSAFFQQQSSSSSPSLASLSPSLSRRLHRQDISALNLFDSDRDEKELEEEARLKIWESRRGQIRGVLKSAEKQRNYRIENGECSSCCIISNFFLTPTILTKGTH